MAPKHAAFVAKTGTPSTTTLPLSPSHDPLDDLCRFQTPVARIGAGAWLVIHWIVNL
jgi:hypothetical protein